MGWHHALALGVCVGFCSPMAEAGNTPEGDAQVSASSTKAKPAQTKRQRRVKQRKRAQKRRKRKRARAQRANLPSGWQWPPSEEMKAQGATCKEELEGLGVHFTKAPFTRGVATPIYVPDMAFDAITLVPTFRKPPFVIDCHLAVALRKAAPALAQLGVKSLRFSSIYSYRRAIVGGKKKASLSRHSYGLAVDVYEVERGDGEILKVADDYHEGELLKEVESSVNESGRFRLVLSPDNDPRSHSDHLHFEAGVEYPKALARTGKAKTKAKKGKAKKGKAKTGKARKRGASKADKAKRAAP